MLERLFFHWINVHRTGVSIGDCEELSFDIYLGPAFSAIARHNRAFVWTSATPDCTAGQFIIKIGFLYMGIFRRKIPFGPRAVPWKEYRTTGSAKGSFYEISSGFFHMVCSQLVGLYSEGALIALF
jgi:hypothetical protein